MLENEWVVMSILGNASSGISEKPMDCVFDGVKSTTEITGARNHYNC
jgi:hypothetical protein